MGYSELCKSCKICNICHEPQKLIAEHCQHFKGEIPNGFIKYRSCVSRLVYKRGFADNIAYVQRPHEKMWLNRYQLNELLRENEN